MRADLLREAPARRPARTRLALATAAVLAVAAAAASPTATPAGRALEAVAGSDP